MTEPTLPLLTELASSPVRHFLFWVYANELKIRKKVLRVELYENIRREVNFEGLSIRGAATQFKVHRREIRNSLASAIPSERKVAPKRRPKLGQYEATVRKWLAENVDLQRKQRHTATRIWKRLIDECKADVSPSTVRVSVKERKAKINPLVPTTMIPQICSPGECADVDYGDVYVELARIGQSQDICHPPVKFYHGLPRVLCLQSPEVLL